MNKSSNLEGVVSYKFLKNAPIGEDLFEGQSQEKIATVMADNIKTNEFQIIGVDGGWGTGKSNLIEITKKKLDSKEYHFFIYDVWGHQGDEQRKSILIELTDFVTNNHLVKSNAAKEWKRSVNELLSKERAVTTINYPHLSIGFIFSLIAIIYIPIATTFKSSLSNLLGIESEYWTLFIAFLPIVGLLAIISCYFLQECLKSLKNFKQWNWRNIWKIWKPLKCFKFFYPALQETFVLYVNKQKTETKLETIIESEPSVRAFRKWMEDIDKDLIQNKKKLIIVFDNFDRLPKQYIQHIWSSIHIFFSEKQYKNIKVIIPFDRLHIKCAFSDLNKINDMEQIDFANDYINKTFDIVFRISPPIMSDWKIFFKQNWEQAFLNHAEIYDEYIRVEQIYESCKKIKTPREIIVFINEIVSIKLIHNNIPEQYIAYFVINKDKILKDPLKAITQELGVLEYLYKGKSEFEKYITALAYQISPDNALEVIYRKQLRESLLHGDIEALNNIARTNIFSQIIFPTIWEFDNFEDAIITLHNIIPDAKITEQEKQTLWDDIYLNIQLSPIEEINLPECYIVLLTHISNYYKQSWVEKICNNLLSASKFEAVDYAKSIDKLQQVILNNKFDINVFNLISNKEIKAHAFISLVHEKNKNYEDYRLITTNEELNDYLSKLDVNELSNIDCLKFIRNKFEWERFSQSLVEKISKNKSDLSSLSVIFKLRKIIDDRPLKFILTDQEIYELFIQPQAKEQNFYYDLIAMRIARGNEFPSSYGNYFGSVLNVSEDNNFIKNIVQCISYYIDYGDLLLASLTFKNPLTTEVIRYLVEERSPILIADTSELLRKFDQICQANNLSPTLLIKNFSDWEAPDFDNDLIQSLISSNYFEYAQSLVDEKNSLAITSIKALHSYFDNFTKEEWVSCFSQLNGNTYKYLNQTGYTNWNSYALEAFKDILVSFANSGKNNDSTKLTELIRNIESSDMSLASAFNNIRDVFIDNGKMTAQQFIFFGDWLFKYGALAERSDDVIRRIIIADLLDSEECINILSENKDILKTILKEAKNEISKDFKDAIKIRSNNNESIEILRKHLRISSSKLDTKNEGATKDQIS